MGQRTTMQQCPRWQSIRCVSDDGFQLEAANGRKRLPQKQSLKETGGNQVVQGIGSITPYLFRAASSHVTDVTDGMEDKRSEYQGC
ncbi:MAG: hypothetical protein CSA33_06065 [Desulfobulbus propionicus]|nr:MAG: hypothetical protein CSA33_06065 [Desulfobulbus propionicus]